MYICGYEIVEALVLTAFLQDDKTELLVTTAEKMCIRINESTQQNA